MQPANFTAMGAGALSVGGTLQALGAMTLQLSSVSLSGVVDLSAAGAGLSLGGGCVASVQSGGQITGSGMVFLGAFDNVITCSS